MNLSKNISIEELIEIVPESVSYLMNRGIQCIACGEPVWGTLEHLVKEKGVSEMELEGILHDLNNFYKNTPRSDGQR